MKKKNFEHFVCGMSVDDGHSGFCGGSASHT